MTPDWSNFILQLPIVAAFIWYSLTLQDRYQRSMDKRDDAYLMVLEKISNCLDAHDDKVDKRIDTIVKSTERATQPHRRNMMTDDNDD
jgi:hypothetical protein